MVFTSLPSPFGFLKAFSSQKAEFQAPANLLFIHQIRIDLPLWAMHCSRHLGCSVEQNQQSRQPSRCVYPSPEPSSAVFPRKYYTPTLTCWNTEFHSYPYSLACGALCFTTYIFKVELKARLGIQLALVKSHLTGWAKTQTRSFISLICGMGKTKLTNI